MQEHNHDARTWEVHAVIDQQTDGCSVIKNNVQRDSVQRAILDAAMSEKREEDA